MRWVEVVEAEADAVAALVAAADVGPGVWEELRPLAQAVTVSAPVAGTQCRTSSVSPAIRKSAPNVARR
ncbi:MAG: hypothetical protein ACK2US_01135 [Anaerolineae bacterium]